MKERVLVFSDAIIAIILTIIVLELPIKYFNDGSVDWISLIQSVGIYFISFCFVANLWFQTAYAFNHIDQIKNKILVIYMFLLFLLSLIPSATRLLIEDTTQTTIFIYGVLTLIVTMVMRRLIVALTKQSIKVAHNQARRIKELNRQDLMSIIFRFALLLFSQFFIHAALIIYLILPILAFLQNIIDREENQIVDRLDQEQQADYFKNRHRLWGNQMKRYSHLLRDSLQANNGDSSNNWQQIMIEWQKNLDEEIEKYQKQLLTKNKRDNKRLEFELRQLLNQKKRLKLQEERLNNSRIS
ncbi:DUF1211 domain-containing protein [Enterococcus sp. MMGLQ5-2]|nr:MULTISPECIES: TMEM175 family protein [unclassified Enterococcus]MBS7576538.1 DUF1211 domain-containing protein [Enterococcus sp. MMGLQ5-2]MBS7583975.1 DUF1211 domain-containing protein [Enterococcus sp. MMGLQ5-1]